MKLWIPLALLSAAFSALVALLTKKCFACSNMDAIVATAINAFVGTSFIVLVALTLGKIKLLPTYDSQAYTLIILAGIAGCLSTLCYFFALKIAPPQYLPAVVAFYQLSVAFALIFAVIGFGDRPTVTSVAGTVLMVAGALLLAFK